MSETEVISGRIQTAQSTPRPVAAGGPSAVYGVVRDMTGVITDALIGDDIALTFETPATVALTFHGSMDFSGGEGDDCTVQAYFVVDGVTYWGGPVAGQKYTNDSGSDSFMIYMVGAHTLTAGAHTFNVWLQTDRSAWTFSYLSFNLIVGGVTEGTSLLEGTGPLIPETEFCNSAVDSNTVEFLGDVPTSVITGRLRDGAELGNGRLLGACETQGVWEFSQSGTPGADLISEGQLVAVQGSSDESTNIGIFTVTTSRGGYVWFGEANGRVYRRDPDGTVTNIAYITDWESDWAGGTTRAYCIRVYSTTADLEDEDSLRIICMPGTVGDTQSEQSGIYDLDPFVSSPVTLSSTNVSGSVGDLNNSYGGFAVDDCGGIWHQRVGTPGAPVYYRDVTDLGTRTDTGEGNIANLVPSNLVNGCYHRPGAVDPRPLRYNGSSFVTQLTPILDISVIGALFEGGQLGYLGESVICYDQAGSGAGDMYRLTDSA